MTAEHKVTVRYYASHHEWIVSCSGCLYGVNTPSEDLARSNAALHEARHK